MGGRCVGGCGNHTLRTTAVQMDNDRIWSDWGKGKKRCEIGNWLMLVAQRTAVLKSTVDWDQNHVIVH